MRARRGRPSSPSANSATSSAGAGLDFERGRDAVTGGSSGWRVVVICTVRPLAEDLIGKLRALGHEPVALLAPRGFSGPPRPSLLELTGPDRAGRHRPSLRARQACDRAAPPCLRARPDDLLGLPVEDPAGRARRAPPRLHQPAPGPAAAPPRPDSARLGAPRRRRRLGPDVASHGCRARYGEPARAGDGADRGRRCRHRDLRGQAQARRGRSAPAGAGAGRGRRSGRSAAGGGRDLGRPFEDDDYVRIDWSDPARAIHNQVRAWQLTFGLSGLRAPIAELDGEEVVVLQTRLTDPVAARDASSVATARSGSSRPSPSDVARRGLGFGAVLADRRAIGCRL